MIEPMELDPALNPSPYGAEAEPPLDEAQAMLDESEEIAANLITDWKPSGLDEKAATVETKELSSADKADLARENGKIRANVATIGAVPHPFEAAEWTHPNGHPRCALCGGEEPIGGACLGDMVPTGEGARSPSRPKEARGDVKYSDSEDRDNSGRWTAGGGEVAPLSEVARESLDRYTGGGYAAINGKLRGGFTPYPDDKQGMKDYRNADKLAAGLQSILTPATTGTTLFRGLDQHAVEVLTGLPHAENLSDEDVAARLKAMIGVEFEDKGFVSTSKAEAVAGSRTAVEGTGHVVIELDVPAGVRSLDVNAVPGPPEAFFKAFAEEKEVILEPGLKFQITGYRETTVVSTYQHAGFAGHVIKVAVLPRKAVVASLSGFHGDRFVWDARDFVVEPVVGQKGDASGHPFHGNRYTGGIGDGGKLSVAKIQAAGSSLKPHQIAKILESFAAAEAAEGKPPSKDTSMTDHHPEYGGLRGDQVVALASYQRSGYAWMNDRLRAGAPPIINELTGEHLLEEERWRDSQIKAIDNAMEPSRGDMSVYRAIGDGGLEQLLADGRVGFGLPRGQELRDALASLKGSVIEDKAFCSTTTDKSAAGARVYHGEVVVQIDVPKGTGYIDMNAHHLNDESYAHEKELLLARGGKFEITGISDKPTQEFGSEFPVYVLHMRRAA